MAASSILLHSGVLIAALQADATDSDLDQLRDELTQRAGARGVYGAVLDVSALDVVDSFAARTLQTIARAVELRGAQTVIVGIQPEVAVAMVQLGITLEDVHTALDLEAALEQMTRPAARGRR
jgi:rsbT antagonist protein RsbS